MVKSAVNQNSTSASQYLKESIVELKKVVWPTKKQVIKMTGVVIAVSLITGIFIGLLDLLFTKAIGLIIN
ncbi:MAG: preprotein translocase subunit SecE [Candidatus Beckwithbacteria bacterium]|nr:preprotein translocase subunit SecE [Patescibacteria group bacterium]